MGRKDKEKNAEQEIKKDVEKQRKSGKEGKINRKHTRHKWKDDRGRNTKMGQKDRKWKGDKKGKIEWQERKEVRKDWELNFESLISFCQAGLG